MACIRVGISGWTYRGWRGDFYPRGLPQRLELAHAAERMTSIEINGTFYALQRPSSYLSWRGQAPADFVFAVKGGRFITHMKKLRDVETALANFFASGLLALGPKLGPILWQLPSNLGFDEHLLSEFFALLPRSTAAAAQLADRHDSKVADNQALTTAEVDLPLRHALEPRHASFDTKAAAGLLGAHDICLVMADSAGRWPRIEAHTSDYRYLRLHGDTELYASGYADAALDRWAGLCREWAAHGQDVYVYFDNDAKGFAPWDALALIARLGALATPDRPEASS